MNENGGVRKWRAWEWGGSITTDSCPKVVKILLFKELHTQEPVLRSGSSWGGDSLSETFIWYMEEMRAIWLRRIGMACLEWKCMKRWNKRIELIWKFTMELAM